MNLNFRAWLSLAVVLTIILISVVQPSDAEAEYNSRNRNQAQRERRNNCDCRYAQDSPLCASNGVTYPSMCRFECAKARVKRLRIVSGGSCRGKSLNDYRRGQRSG